MKFYERIKLAVQEIDPGKPILKLSIGYSKTSIRVDQPNWNPQIEDSFIGNLIRPNLRRGTVFHGSDSGFVIDIEHTVNAVKDYILTDFSRVYKQCSLNKEPTRTKGFKQLKKLIRCAYREEEIFDDMFKIYEYFDSVTQSSTIRSENNDVHRRNILHLIDVLGKKHGR